MGHHRVRVRVEKVEPDRKDIDWTCKLAAPVQDETVFDRLRAAIFSYGHIQCLLSCFF